MARTSGGNGMYVHQSRQPVNVKDYGAVGDGVADDTAEIAAAYAAADAAGAALYFPAGTYLFDGLTITDVTPVIGDGQGLTTLKASSNVTGQLLNFSGATRKNYNALRRVHVDMTNEPTAKGVVLDDQGAFVIEDCLFTDGAEGLYVVDSSSGKFERLNFKSQSTVSFHIQADGGAEHFIRTVSISNDNPAYTPAAAFWVERTSATDVGGFYIDTLRVTQGAGGAITNGWKFTYSLAGFASIPTLMTRCVSDLVKGGAAVLFQRVSSIYVGESYITTDPSNTTSPGVLIDGGNSIQIFNSFLYARGASATGAVEFVNAPAKLQFEGLRVPGGTVFSIPASNPPTDMVMGYCQFNDATAIADDMTRLVTALGVGGRGNVIGPHAVLVATGGGLANWFVLQEPGGNKKGFRVTSGASLQVMNNAGSVAIMGISDAGIVSTPAAGGYFTAGPGAQQVRSGGGSPDGVVTAPAGSIFMRTDGGAGTTLYVKESGAGNTGWVAK